jgi:hypothetical protein
MRTTIGRLAALLALFSAGALVAGLLAAGGFALDTTTETLTESTAITQTTTEPGQTVVTTATVEQTTTRRIILPAQTTPTTTAEGNNGGETPTWLWVLVGLLAVVIVVLAVVLLTRRGSGVSAEERSRRLDAAVRSWAAQGYALESQSADSAVVRRGSERLRISVDATGAVASQPLTTNEWPSSG